MATAKRSDMVPLHFLVPKDLKAALEKLAKDDRRSLAETVRMALERLVAESGK